MILLADLELQALVCSGRPSDDGTHTYARFADRVPSPRRLDRGEALAELALRYFTGHGPATERDLSYWATLPLGDVRAGLAQVSDRLESFEHDGRTFWHAPADRPTAAGTPTGHLLQILDETYRGYQDSRWVLDGAGIVPRARETAAGMALVDAQLVAAMKRTVARRPGCVRAAVRTVHYWPTTWPHSKRRPADTATSSAVPECSNCAERRPASDCGFWARTFSENGNVRAQMALGERARPDRAHCETPR